MRFVIYFSFLFVLICNQGYSQLNMPEGYQLALDINDSYLILTHDFNKDGMIDTFAVIEKEGNAKLIAILSKGSKSKITITHNEGNFYSCCASIVYKKNILTLTTKGMRYFEYYKFRFNKKLANFELIGHDTESFGNAIHDGAGTKSVNLLTRDYEYSTYSAIDENSGETKSGKRKIKLPKKFTLSNFNEAIEFLSDLESY